MGLNIVRLTLELICGSNSALIIEFGDVFNLMLCGSIVDYEFGV